jgi:hypothetical protein
MYSKFWEQVVEYALRPTESGGLTLTQEYSDGKVKVTIDARDSANRPLTDLELKGGVTSPSSRSENDDRIKLQFKQKNSGLYEAEFKAEEAGSYFINVQTQRSVKKTVNGKEVVEQEMDGVRGGVTVPYSPEFSDLESNTALMERLREATGGKTIPEDWLAVAANPRDAEAPAMQTRLAQEAFRSGLPQFKNLQPVWYWLVFAAGVLLFFDVAVRRVAVQPAEVAGVAQRVWMKLRGRAIIAAETPQFIDRLQSRKAQVSQTLEQLRAARRFEPSEQLAEAPAGADVMTPVAPPTPARPAPQQRIAPEREAEAADYASRLLKAKKRVWQQRENEDK